MNNKLIDLFDNFKVVVYVPYDFKDTFLKKLTSEQFNKIGEYINCASWAEVESTWTPTNCANPYIGKANEQSIEKEIRFEFYCEKVDLEKIIKHIEDIHPYEKAEIDILPMILI